MQVIRPVVTASTSTMAPPTDGCLWLQSFQPIKTFQSFKTSQRFQSTIWSDG